MLKEMQERQLINKRLFYAAILSIAVILFNTTVCSQTPGEAYIQGSADLIAQNYDAAINNLSVVIVYNNADEELFIKRGRAYLAIGETDKAIADFQEANQIIPDIADLWLARTYAKIKNYDLAIGFLKNHLSSDYKVSEDSIKKDAAFDQLQETREWFNLWQNNWYDDTERTIADAHFFARKKNYVEAIAVLDKSISLNPMNDKLLAKRAEFCYQSGNYSAAIADYNTLIRNDRNTMYYYSERGKAYIEAGKYKDALTDLNKVIKDDPAEFDLYKLRAKAYAGMQQWSQAVKDMEFYLRYFNYDQDALFTCGEYCYNGGDYINALKYFNVNLSDNPNDSRYYKARGKTYYQTSVYRFAYNDLSMALDLDPSDAETWMLMGLVKHFTGEKQKSCSDLNKALNMGASAALKYITEYCNE